MDEDSVRTLLTKLVDAPERLPARIDIEQARRDGRRRQLTARAAIPAAVLTAAAALALGVIVTVPHALSSSTERARPTVAASHPATPVPVAPDKFNPLVPYAGFGRLPSGFSEASVSALDGGTFTTGLDTMVRTATQASTTRMLQLIVNSVSACQGITAHPGRPYPSSGVTQDCAFSGYGITGIAPAIDGRLAYWVHYDSLAWEYAPGAWATLTATVQPRSDGGPVSSFANGWTMRVAKDLAARTVKEDSAISNIINNEPQLAIKRGYVIPPSASTLAVLEKVASQVTFGQKQPIVFPFQMSGGLPSGWQLNSASYQMSGDKLIGTSIGFGSALDPSAGSVTAMSPTGYGCDFVTGQSSYVTRYGVSWIYRVIGETDKRVQMLCSTGSADSTATSAGLVNGLQVWVNLDENSPGSNAPLPGVAQFGGAFGIYSRLKFLGTNPAGWTSAPLG
ncbi:MAG TPA: hypothetical protein VI365_05215 [Trebonia sp.]